MNCHTKRVRKIYRDKNFKTTPWQSLPTCFKLTKKSENSNLMYPAEFKVCLIWPHTQPSAPLVSALSLELHKHCQLHFINGFYQMDNNLKHFLKWPASQVMPGTPTSPAKIPASVTQDFRTGSLPRAALCIAKYIRARKKKLPSPPTKTNQTKPNTNKNTLTLQSMDICKKIKGGCLLQGISLSTAGWFTAMTLNYAGT